MIFKLIALFLSVLNAVSAYRLYKLGQYTTALLHALIVGLMIYFLL